MPIYEYQCDACGHVFDKLQKMSDEPLKDCPQCEQSALTKLVSAPSFKLKGSGWYESDFKGNKKAEKTPASTNKSTTEKPASGGCGAGCGCH